MKEVLSLSFFHILNNSTIYVVIGILYSNVNPTAHEGLTELSSLRSKTCIRNIFLMWYICSLGDLRLDGRIILILISEENNMSVNWIHLVQDRAQWQGTVNTVTYLRVP
jgi:hypothetical protein